MFTRKRAPSRLSSRATPGKIDSKQMKRRPDGSYPVPMPGIMLES